MTLTDLSNRPVFATTRSTLLLFALVFAGVTNSTVRADIDSAKSDLGRILGFAAKTTQRFLTDDGQDSLALGTISNQALTSSGTFVAKVLEEKLSSGKNPLEITPNARYQLSGEYYAVENNQKVKFEFVLRDRESGSKIDKFAEAIQGMEIDNRDEIASLLGLTKGPPGSDTGGSKAAGDDADTGRKSGDDASTAGNDRMQATFDGSVVYPVGSTTYGIEILVKNDGRYVPVNADAKFTFPFVDLPLDSRYAIRVVNNSTKYVAMNLRIDGLSVFEYGPRKTNGEAAYSHMLIAPGKAQINGWFISNTKATEFLVSGIGGDGNDDVSNATRRQDGVARIGTITAMFYPAVTGRGGKQTIQGQEISANYKTMQAGWSDTYHSVVSVRYDK